MKSFHEASCVILQFSACQRDSIFEHISTFVSMLEVLVTLLVDSSVWCCHDCCLSDNVSVYGTRLFVCITCMSVVTFPFIGRRLSLCLVALTAAVAGVTMTW